MFICFTNAFHFLQCFKTQNVNKFPKMPKSKKYAEDRLI